MVREHEPPIETSQAKQEASFKPIEEPAYNRTNERSIPREKTADVKYPELANAQYDLYNRPPLSSSAASEISLSRTLPDRTAPANTGFSAINPQQQSTYQPQSKYAPPKGLNIFNIPKSNTARPEHHRNHPHLGWIKDEAKHILHIGQKPPSRPDQYPSQSGFNTAISRPVNVGQSYVVGGSRPNPFPKHSPIYGGYSNGIGSVDDYGTEEELKGLFEGALIADNIPKTRRRAKAEAEAEAQAQAEKEQEEIEEENGTVEGLKVKLFPHQVQGLNFLLSRENSKSKGGLLADDMGLGKTIQSIALILSNRLEDADPKKLPKDIKKGTLVVAPLALVKQWESEISAKIESSHKLKVLVNHGQTRVSNHAELSRYDVVITTYGLLSSDFKVTSTESPVGCFGVNWFRIILDEAHTIKNRNTQQTKACYALRAEHRWCLTGTPMQNNLDELQSLIMFLRVAPYNNYQTWKDQILALEKNGRYALAMKRLRAVLQAIMLRRTKDILLGDNDKPKVQPKGKAVDSQSEVKQNSLAKVKLVRRTVEIVSVQFSPEERKVYADLEARADNSIDRMVHVHQQKMSYMRVLVLILRLRQACDHPALCVEKAERESDFFSDSKGENKKDVNVDEVTEMFGGMTTTTKECETCQTELLPDRWKTGLSICEACERLAVFAKGGKLDKKMKTKAHRYAIEDSDDEDNEEDEEYEDASDGRELTRPGGPMLSAKIRKLIELLRKEAPDHKFIVFSQFTSFFDIVEPFLARSGIVYVRYDGKMRNDKRELSLHALRENSGVRVMLCSLKCGSLGLNLTAASRVVICEPFWNPFIEEQAIDRVHRIGQTVDIKVYRLTVEDTVEQRILNLQEKKRKLANDAIESQKSGGKKKTTTAATIKELLSLFRRGAESNSEEFGTGPQLGTKGLLR